MLSGNLTHKYSSPEAWFHDYGIADRVLNLHAYILGYGKLVDVLSEKKRKIFA